jgi:hypothetical protein
MTYFQFNVKISKYVNLNAFQILEYDLSKFPNVQKWYSKVRNTLVGFDEIQDAAAAMVKQMLANAPQ